MGCVHPGAKKVKAPSEVKDKPEDRYEAPHTEPNQQNSAKTKENHSKPSNGTKSRIIITNLLIDFQISAGDFIKAKKTNFRDDYIVKDQLGQGKPACKSDHDHFYRGFWWGSEGCA